MARAVRAWDPDEVVLLPVYPHYSTTTTASSLTAWREAAAPGGLAKPTTTLRCYHSDNAYLAATTAIVRRSHEEARQTSETMIDVAATCLMLNRIAPT